jgi:hypothetical protein
MTVIDIKTLQAPRDIGRWVEYRGRGGEIEQGRVKGWNPKWVFVVYKCAGHWDRFKDFTGQATDPAELHFISNDTPDVPPPLRAKVETYQGNMAVIGPEEFLKLAEEGARREAVGDLQNADFVAQQAEIVARVIPPHTALEFWAGFATGIAATGGVLGLMIDRHIPEPDARERMFAFTDLFLLAAFIGYNRQQERDAADSSFDELADVEFE